VSSVGEVVVTGSHVVESSSGVHEKESSVEVLVSSVQLVAVVNVVISVGKSRGWEATSLSEIGEPLSERLVSEHQLVWVGSDPSVGDWHGIRQSLHLHDVGTISSVATLTSVTSGVGVTSSPLKVDVISLGDVEELRSKLVLGGGVSLDDVTTLSSNVKVVDTAGVSNSRGAGDDVEHVGTILEGTSELGGIDGKLDSVAVLGDVRIFLEGRVRLVLGVISESSDWVGILFSVGLRV